MRPAQSARHIEKVIVSAPRFHFAVTPNAIAHEFIGSYAMPSLLLGTIPRWHAPICLEIRGVRPEFQTMVEQRVRYIAIEAGAPMAGNACKPNLSITFTPEPQKLLDNIRARNSYALGYHAATSISHPVQAWYATATTDIRGRSFTDGEIFTNFDTDGISPVYSYGNTPMVQVEGMPGRSGLRSDLTTVTIIVDSRQTSGFMVGAVADYVAMLALTQTQAYDTCENLLSITNLLSADCDTKLKPNAITANDVAYLRGLYHMDSGAPLKVQQDQIAGEMAKALGSK